jgi:Transposase DDE domain
LREQFFAYLAAQLDAHLSAYEAVDGTAMPIRNYKRRGLSHLAGLADLGRGHRVSWFYGFHLLLACTAEGVITGYGFAPASTKDQPLLESFLALRHQPNALLLTTGKPAATGVYVADKGFEGAANQQRWRSDYQVEVIVPPRRTSRRPWSSEERKWFAGVRQMVETVFGKLHGEFGLEDERPHELGGMAARLAAKVGLHNFCIWLNRQLGRADLAFADLLAW